MITGKGILEHLNLGEGELKSLIEEHKTYPETESIEVQEASARIMKVICSVVKDFPMALDIASGRGSLLKEVAASHPNIQLLGTDLDENMLKEAQKALRGRELKKYIPHPLRCEKAPNKVGIIPMRRFFHRFF